MAEVTTNFRDSSQGDLGKNLVSREYLISVYPKLASSILPTNRVMFGGNTYLGNTSIPTTFFNGFSSFKSIDLQHNFGTSLITLGIVKNDGTFWGYDNWNGATVGANPTALPSLVQEFTSDTNWKKVFCAGYSGSTCLIKNDGSLWQVGRNNTSAISGGGVQDVVSRPVRELTSSTNWKEARSSNGHTVAIKTDGTLWAWGENRVGELGFASNYVYNTLTGNSSGVRNYSIPTQVGTGTNWDRIIAVSNQSPHMDGSNGQAYNYSSPTAVIASKDDTLWSFGWHERGFLNVPGSIVPTPVPFDIQSSVTWKTIPSTIGGATREFMPVSVYPYSTVAIKSDGTMWTFGSGYGINGQTNSGRLNNFAGFTTYAQEWTSSTNWKCLSQSASSNLAIKTDGTLWFTGSYLNYPNISGISATVSGFQTFVQVGTDTNWKQVSAGNVAFGIKTDGTLWYWGVQRNVSNHPNGYLFLNNPPSTLNVSTPVQEWTSSTNWSQICIKSSHASAIKTDGTLWSWGLNSNGQVGNNTQGNVVSTPVQEFTSSNNWVYVDNSVQNTFAIKNDGSLWGWGDGSNGVFGINVSFGNRPTPVREITSSTNWKQVSVSNDRVSAVKTDGSLWLWGNAGVGTLGFTDFITRSTPSREFTSSNNWNFVNLYANTCIAIKNDGSMWGWGVNKHGQCGYNGWKLSLKTIPTQEFSLSKWQHASAVLGSSQGINETDDGIGAVKEDGTLWIFRNDAINHVNVNRKLYQPLPSEGWKRVFVSSIPFRNAFYAIKTDGTLWQWAPNVNSSRYPWMLVYATSATAATTPFQESTSLPLWKNVISAADQMTILEYSDPV